MIVVQRNLQHAVPVIACMIVAWDSLADDT